MIRWKYVIPRLVLLAMVCALLTFALDPLIRWSLIRAGRQMVGAQCEVGEVDTSIWQTEIVIANVAVANPRAPMTNLIEFEQARLDLDAISLLKKKIVVDTGWLQSVRIGSSRDVSGALADVDEDRAPDGQAAAFALPWTPESMRAKLNELEQQFESPPLVRELQERWPADLARLESQVEYAEQRVEEISALAGEVHDEPVQALARVPEIMDQLQRIRRDRQQLQTEVRQLADQVREDRQAIATARRHDAQRIRDQLKFDATSAEQFGDLVLGPQWTERLSAIFGWVQWTRRLLPHRVDEVKPSRGRGMDVLFPVEGSLPSLLVRELRIDGHWELSSDSVPFKGVLRNLTSEPKQLGKPTVLTAQATGGSPFTVEVELNHGQDPPRDRLGFDCRGFPQPPMSLGKEGQLVVHLEPGEAHIALQLAVTGDVLTGQATIRQDQMQLTTTWGPELQGSAFAEGFQNQVANISALETSVLLSGTVRQPRGTVESTLTQELSTAINTAVRQELQHQQNMTITRLNEQIDQQLARVESTLQQKQEELLAKLKLGDTALQEITNLLPAGSAVGNILGGRMPWQRRL